MTSASAPHISIVTADWLLHRDDVRSLFFDYLTELSSLGSSEILPTERTLDFWMSLYDNYCAPETSATPMAGVALVALADGVPVGFSLAGAAPLPYDTTFGQLAYGWGTYVQPSHRGLHIASELREAMRLALKALGFETLLGGVHLNNDVGIKALRGTGFEPYQLSGFIRLQPTSETSED
jgi:GNAT superfamily N-acetyltransferase